MCWHLLHERPLSKYIHTEKGRRKCRTKFLCRSMGVLLKNFFYTDRLWKCTHCPITELNWRIYCKTTIQSVSFGCFYSALIATILTQLFNNNKIISLCKKINYEQILYFIVHCICFYVKNTWHLKWFFDISSN